MKRILIIFLVAFTAFTYAAELQLIENKEFSGLPEVVVQAEFSPFRDYFVYTLGDNSIHIYDKNWEKVFEHQGNPESRGGSFDFSPDGALLAYAKYKGETDIAIIDLSAMKVIQVLDKHSSYIYDLEFSHDGNFLSSSSYDNSMMLWKREGEEFHHEFTLEGFESYLYESAFSHDDRFLATGDSYGHVKILERHQGTYVPFQEFQVRRHGVSSIVFHPTKYQLLTGSSYGIRRYRLSGGSFEFTDSVAKKVYIRNPMTFSPQGEYLATTYYSQVKIYTVGEDSLVLNSINHRHGENTLGATFSEDGRFLTTFAADKKVIIWEVSPVAPSNKALVSSWLIGDLSLAQRRSLTPSVTSKIIKATDRSLALPRDEFEKTSEYNDRMEQLSDQTLKILQQEMERIYGVKRKGKTVSIELDALMGYNADLEIYKIRLMDTEAGVKIPVDEARRLKSKWDRAEVKADREKIEGKVSMHYSDFRLIHPVSGKSYEVIPLENPFQQKEAISEDLRMGERGNDAPAVSDTVNGTTYALLFATNVYEYFGDLVNPVLDAQTIAAELKENYGVVTEVVINPTLEQTAAKMREFASAKYSKKDNLLVFFAGHGVYDEVFQEGYVISRDSRTNDIGKTSYLSHSNLRTMVNNIRCPHIFLVMDVCFGGTFDPHLASTHRGASMYSDVSTAQFVERKQKYKTRLYLTSGGKEYVPDGRPGFHSPFARRFIESLRHYGGDDGVLTTAEILQFVEKTNPQPRFGEFGDNEPGSDFILVLKNEAG